MGWDSWSNEKRGTDEILRGEFTGNVGHKILASGTKGGAWYAALQPKGEGYVTALVVLYRRGGGNFAYKAMDETMGPSATGCPASVLRHLSPVEQITPSVQMQDWARQWREACYAATTGSV